MAATWLVFFLQLGFLSLFRPLLGDPDVALVFVIGITSIPLMFEIMRCPRKAQIPITLGYLLRLSVMFFDVYGAHYFSLPHSGVDSEGFHSAALLVASDPSMIGQSIYGGIYSKLLGLVYMVGGPNRLLGQFVNVLFGMTTIFIVQAMLTRLKVSPQASGNAIALMSLFPQSIVLSSIMLRESVICLLIAASTYFLIKWSLTNNPRDAGFSVLMLLLGSAFHAGVAGLIAGYFFMFVFYRPKKTSFSAGWRSFAAFALMILLLGFAYFRFGAVFFGKLQSIDDMSDVYSIVSGGRGDSAYLTSIRIESFGQLMIYAPIKMLYLIAAPLPQNWRGMSDILAFVLDSTVYVYLVTFAMRQLRALKKNAITVGLLIMLLGGICVFGLGVSNAGAAMRHRHKLLSTLVMLYALIKDSFLNDRRARQGGCRGVRLSEVNAQDVRISLARKS